MPQTLKPAPGEKYTLRRKVVKLLGAGFHIYGPNGEVVAYCKQRAFRLREALTVYTDDSESNVLLRIGTQQIIDFGASYQVTLASGDVIGSMRRRGMKSFLRDEWMVFDESGKHVASLMEDSGALAIMRRVVDNASWLMPQTFHLRRAGDGEKAAPIVTYRTHFNPFVYRLGVAVHSPDEVVDDLMILALACLIGAIEGRQG